MHLGRINFPSPFFAIDSYQQFIKSNFLSDADIDITKRVRILSPHLLVAGNFCTGVKTAVHAFNQILKLAPTLLICAHNANLFRRFFGWLLAGLIQLQLLRRGSC